MAAMTEVRATVDAGLKEKAEAIYAEVGLTLDEVFGLLLKRTVEDHSLPFPSYTPGPITQEAMRAARRGELTTVNSLEELFAELNADD